jgi:3-oxoacyl-ACP reductase-like protein
MRFALVAGVVALACTPAALAGTPAENASAAASLKPLVAKKFKAVAPKLVIGKVTCKTLVDGVTAICRAHFADMHDGVNVTYTIKAVLHDVSNSLTWSTTAHSCTSIKSGKNVPC